MTFMKLTDCFKHQFTGLLKNKFLKTSNLITLKARLYYAYS